MTNNGYTEYYIMTIGKCTNDDDSLWYIRESHIILAANDNCLAVVNSNKLGAKNATNQFLKPYMFKILFLKVILFELDSTIAWKIEEVLLEIKKIKMNIMNG